LEGARAAEARRIIKVLREAGFVAYLAGGCVRDALLGRAPKDYDVATDATPAAVRDLFGHQRTLAFGVSFGVIGVLPPPTHGAAHGAAHQGVEPTEVATFRSDGEYSDGRRPNSVHFGDAQQDALRRDFTINGLFYDPQSHEVIDFVGGQADLSRSVLRTIGDPSTRFFEDKLRMLRAVRFATTIDFKIDPATFAAIQAHAPDIRIVSGERIGAEMRRILQHSNAARGLQTLIDCGLDAVVLPEVRGVDLHRFATSVQIASQVDFAFALACLLVNHSDPRQSLGEITARWKLSNDEVRRTTAALDHWRIVADAERLPWSVVQPVLIDRDVEIIVALAEAQVVVDRADTGGVELARRSLQWPATQLNPPPLLSGNDLVEYGIARGPEFGRLLKAVRDAQLDQRISTRAAAWQLIEAHRSKS
jgi:tRNA nucleotidyltransferase (CCA-adding enzyme)